MEIKPLKDRYLKGVYQKLPPNDMSLGRNYRWYKNKNSLTPKQLKLYKYLIEYANEKEIMPTVREMMTYMKSNSTSNIFKFLEQMEYKGYIKRIPAHARAIQIIKEVA
jgi:repressor LexA